MRIAVPKEIAALERRVALVPDAAGKLVAAGHEVVIESGAGAAAFFPDDAYRHVGAKIAPSAEALYADAQVILKVQKPLLDQSLGRDEVELMPSGAALIGFLQPLTDLELVRRLALRKITGFSMDMVPRITRAQGMDALSSMSTIAGYKAVLIAASTLGKFLPMLITAAGTIAPSRVLVLGAGVAGLQAIATARRLGAVVEAFDTRPVVKEQVQSLGASFVELELAHEAAEGAGGYAKQMSADFYRQERELIHRHVRQSDIVISTALVPGKRAPILITEEMVRDMHPGSVIVDLASEMGGNCALTVPGKTTVKFDVTIHAPLNLPSTVPMHASQMYSKNIANLLSHLLSDGQLHIDFADEITRGTCITHEGQVVSEAVRELIGQQRRAA